MIIIKKISVTLQNEYIYNFKNLLELYNIHNKNAKK